VQSQKAFSKTGAVLDERKPYYRFLKLDWEMQEDIPELLYYHIDMPIEKQ